MSRIKYLIEISNMVDIPLKYTTSSSNEFISLLETADSIFFCMCIRSAKLYFRALAFGE